MADCRNFRINFAIRSSMQCLVLLVLSLLLLACQMTVAPSEAEPQQPTDVAVEAAVPTEPLSEEPRPVVTGLIQLRDPLDEPEFYCVDVPGFGRSLNLQGALTAHTCKPGADDEMFLMNSPATGLIYMPAYDLCMKASDAEPGSSLLLAPCSEEPLQQFLYENTGQIRLGQGSAEGELCLTVSPEAGEPTGGPSHLRRDLTLEACDQAAAARSLWTVGSPTVVTDEGSAGE